MLLQYRVMFTILFEEFFAYLSGSGELPGVKCCIKQLKTDHGSRICEPLYSSK